MSETSFTMCDPIHLVATNIIPTGQTQFDIRVHGNLERDALPSGLCGGVKDSHGYSRI